MALNVRAFFRNLVDFKDDLPKLAVGGAWLFAIGSLFPLLWLINDGAADGHVFGTTVGSTTYTIPLLAYSGGIGMLLIWAEILAVAGAFILTAAPRVPLKLARIGHGVLIAWSALWTLGTWRLSVIDPGFWTAQALFLSVLGACTVWRAWKNWTPAPGSPSSSPSPHAPEPKASDNYFSDAPPASQDGTPDTSIPTRQQIAEALERARAAAVAASRKIAIGVRAGINAARNDGAKT